MDDERIATPGAYSDTHRPQLENVARASSESLAATVKDLTALAGETLQAFLFWFPAAMTGRMPAENSRSTASFTALVYGPVSARLATAGITLFTRSQSMAAISSGARMC